MKKLNNIKNDSSDAETKHCFKPCVITRCSVQLNEMCKIIFIQTNDACLHKHPVTLITQEQLLATTIL
jgi:hypothetical protein